ncbi:predicted protein [Naegleria gruberi]|uniref:Predicted protein n=1 Tax=Naegleria gruberi TaxID=5762 RepID=D2VSN3_NAEGR|nr:uncharacterized protein NAEGRDRAFT_72001 [Naegleria gruberi]EFC40154.1 predicted protein [Naegleria gruberi]|eukprot:XP_002672898.1 predicted protein [Naegleria gruberi strain NEG-M]
MLTTLTTSSNLKIDGNLQIDSLPSSLLVSTQPQHHQQQQDNLSSYSITVWRKSSHDSSFHTKIVERRKHERRNKLITRKEMIKVLHLSQNQACKVLNCSLSTLKRRFYQLKDEIGLDRWPQYFKEVRHLPIFNQMYPMSLEFILNDPNTCQQDETISDPEEFDDTSN